MSAHHSDVVLAMPPGENYCRHILQELKKIPGINLRMVMQKSICEYPFLLLLLKKCIIYPSEYW